MASRANPARRLKAMLENYLEARKEGPKYGYEIRTVEPGNYEHFYILVKPLAGVYKGQKYIMEMKTTYGRGADQTTYPNNAPYTHFVSNIFHVNISANGGSICLDILKDKDKWSPLNSFDTIVQNILLLFNEPNNASPYNGEASKVWVACEKKYKATNNKGLSVKEDDDLHAECFEPFVKEAKRVMKTNNFKQFAKWFPELDVDSHEYKQRMDADAVELGELEEMYLHLKGNKNSASAPAPEDKVQAPTTATAAEHEAPTQATAAPEPTEKKKRWAKYQK